MKYLISYTIKQDQLYHILVPLHPSIYLLNRCDTRSNAGDMGSIPGQEEPLEEEMATHSSILTQKIP